MATLSKYGLGVKLRKEQLVSQLVCQILGVEVICWQCTCTRWAGIAARINADHMQPGADKYELAMDTALQRLHYHHYGDPNPSEVEQNFQG